MSWTNAAQLKRPLTPSTAKSRFAGVSHCRKNKATNKKTAISSTILSALAVVFGIVGIVMFFTAVDQLGNDLNQITTDLQDYSDCLSEAENLDEMNQCEQPLSLLTLPEEFGKGTSPPCLARRPATTRTRHTPRTSPVESVERTVPAISAAKRAHIASDRWGDAPPSLPPPASGCRASRSTLRLRLRHPA